VRRPPIVASAVAVALVALGVVGGITGSTAAKVVAAHATTAPITAGTLVCPALDGALPATSTSVVAADFAGSLSPPSTSAGTVRSTVLAGKASKTTALSLVPAAILHSTPKVNQTVAISASGSVAASLAADEVGLTSAGRFRGLYGVNCVAPATDWWFAGADGRVGYTDALIIANPGRTACEISISLWGVKGPLQAPTVSSVRVPARTAMRVSVASIAPDAPTLAVHVHASSGAVTAALIDRRSSGLKPDGSDFLPATAAPARSAVVPGFAPGPGQRQLVLADPGTVDATVNVRLVTRSGSFVPVGNNQIVVKAGHTRVVTLDKAFAGTTGAVALTSDQPVVAQGLSVTTAPRPRRPDLMWLAAVPPLVGSTGIADGREPDGGSCSLLLSAPEGRAEVTIRTPSGRTSTISIPAGRSVDVDITSTIRPPAGRAGSGVWPFVVTAVGSAPVYGVRVLQFGGAHGALITGEPLIALPTPTVLPSVRSDPALATR